MPAFPASAASVGDRLSVQGGQTQHKGNCDGYSYEVWLDNTGGSGSMTLGKGATFKAEWNASVNRGNFLARRGKDFGSTKKATDYEYIGMDYKANYQQTGSASGNSRLCVYGWFQNRGAAGNVPLVEYYIIEDWVDWCPDGNGKMVTIDGAQYKIFQMDHTGPSINSGSETFKQYFSVRQSKRTSGHITVSEHFKAWAQQGWGIGNLYEVALNAEGWQSSGVADVTELDVYTDPSKAPGGSGQQQVTQQQGTTATTQQQGQGQQGQWTQQGQGQQGQTASGQVLKVGNGNPNQHKGNSDGFSYEIWLDNTGGSGSM
ncbi:MAG: glycoside hydrolase family 11 protein, partial [Oscillospiraceae bacterium]|nr:glycoside hydrolase family 11 protein [Oscillospiraceae bacterium]